MPSNPRRGVWLALAGLTFCILIWASNNIVGKILLLEASPMLIALLRFTLAGIFFYLPAFLMLHRGEARFTRAEWPRLVFLGVVGVLGSLVFYLLGLRTTPATEAGIYQITTPLFVVVIAWLWVGERMSSGRLVGVAIAAAGAALLVTGGSAAGLGGGDLVGALFILASNLTWALYTLLSKGLLARRSPLLILATVNLVATVASWPIAAVMGAVHELPSILSWTPTAWLIMIYLVAFMSTGSQWLYVRSLRDVPASQAAAFQYLMPLFTAVLAAIFLGEHPTPVALAAGVLILAGMWMINRPRQPRARRPGLTPAPQPLGEAGAPQTPAARARLRGTGEPPAST